LKEVSEAEIENRLLDLLQNADRSAHFITYGLGTKG